MPRWVLVPPTSKIKPGNTVFLSAKVCASASQTACQTKAQKFLFSLGAPCFSVPGEFISFKPYRKFSPKYSEFADEISFVKLPAKIKKPGRNRALQCNFFQLIYFDFFLSPGITRRSRILSIRLYSFASSAVRK